jgi:FkbM family methyltransferase
MKVRGIPLALHPAGDYVSDRIRSSGEFFEAAILDDLRTRITGGVLVDAGAMIGNHSVYFAAFLPHSAIHAFEPMPDNLALLRRNVARFPTVTVHAAALSDHIGTLRMSEYPRNRGGAAVDPLGPLEVRAITLDSLGLEDVTLFKIDVERHEPQVLAGARDTIARCHPLIVIEDWDGIYATELPGYRVIADWATMHQTYLYEPVAA